MSATFREFIACQACPCYFLASHGEYTCPNCGNRNEVYVASDDRPAVSRPPQKPKAAEVQ